MIFINFRCQKPFELTREIYVDIMNEIVRQYITRCPFCNKLIYNDLQIGRAHV